MLYLKIKWLDLLYIMVSFKDKQLDLYTYGQNFFFKVDDGQFWKRWLVLELKVDFGTDGWFRN